VVLGVAMSATAPAVVLLLKMKPDTIALVRLTLMALGLLIPVKSFNLHMIVGVLRSGGDTKFSFLTELIGVWSIGVPLAFVTGLVWHLSLPAVYLLVGIEEVFKLVLTGWRMHSGRWINDLTRKDIEEYPVLEPTVPTVP
jgi:Na+-driven multidrug efflux pump